MDDTIFDRLGKRYIGDPTTVGLPESVYSQNLEFDAEELTQKTLKKRYLVSAILGDKYDTVAITVVQNVKLLVNIVGFSLLLLSVILLVTHFSSMGASAVNSAKGAIAGQTANPYAEQQRMLQQQMQVQ